MAPLISEEYRRQNALLHAKRKDYGAGGGRWVREVAWLAKKHNCETILDYGCAKGNLKRKLEGVGWTGVYEYDPALDDKQDKQPCDLVVCTDVLEHVEPDCLNDVLADIHVLTGKLAFLVIALGPSDKTLPDGRNAHLIQEDASWWRDLLGVHFQSLETMRGRGLSRELVIRCSP